MSAAVTLRQASPPLPLATAPPSGAQRFPTKPQPSHLPGLPCPTSHGHTRTCPRSTRSQDDGEQTPVPTTHQVSRVLEGTAWPWSPALRDSRTPTLTPPPGACSPAAAPLPQPRGPADATLSTGTPPSPERLLGLADRVLCLTSTRPASTFLQALQHPTCCSPSPERAAAPPPVSRFPRSCSVTSVP